MSHDSRSKLSSLAAACVCLAALAVLAAACAEGDSPLPPIVAPPPTATAYDPLPAVTLSPTVTLEPAITLAPTVAMEPTVAMGPSLTPIPSPTPWPGREWEIHRITSENSTVTVELQVFAGIDVRVTLDGEPPGQVTYSDGILKHVFEDVTPGVHTILVTDVVGHTESRELVLESQFQTSKSTPTPAITPIAGALSGFTSPHPVEGVGEVQEALIGGQVFRLEVARTSQERARGLMNRPSLPRDSAMLFVFDEEAHRSFWMKNTLIPLDILYLDSGGIVVDVQTMTPQPGVPDSQLARYPSAEPARYAIEINAGLALELGIEPGAQALFR